MKRRFDLMYTSKRKEALHFPSIFIAAIQYIAIPLLLMPLFSLFLVFFSPSPPPPLLPPQKFVPDHKAAVSIARSGAVYLRCTTTTYCCCNSLPSTLLLLLLRPKLRYGGTITHIPKLGKERKKEREGGRDARKQQLRETEPRFLSLLFPLFSLERLRHNFLLLPFFTREQFREMEWTSRERCILVAT